MIISAIKKRRSVRAYKQDMVSDEIIEDIIKAAEFAPSAMGRHAIEYVVIRDQKIKERIFDVIDQEYIKSAPVLVVPVAGNQTALAVEDLTLASAHIFLQAAEYGLGTVWKHLKPEWVQQVKEIINIPSDCKIINIIPLGSAAEKKEPHADEEFSPHKIHQEVW